jgi:hypothetical protein
MDSTGEVKLLSVLLTVAFIHVLIFLSAAGALKVAPPDTILRNYRMYQTIAPPHDVKKVLGMGCGFILAIKKVLNLGVKNTESETQKSDGRSDRTTQQYRQYLHSIFQLK